FLVSWFLSPEEIQAVVNSNSMEVMTDKVNSALISVSAAEGSKEEVDNVSGEDIEIINIAGRNYSGTLMKVKDPSRISLATIYPWRDKGVTLDQLVNGENAIAGVNGGLYDSQNNTGGKPLGVLVSKGEIQHNEPQECGGLVLVGFTEDNILQIIDINGMNKTEVENLIKENHIRDAVCFQEEYSDANNHFVQLIINGNTRGMNGLGSGLNPRTAIGQCADGSVLLLVTDGRGKAGHLGASAADLIEVMEKYGAVNAANLDGGSSSCMYYEGEYLMSSVTFYYSNYSWRLPAAFVVK
ncbi:MAG: phosphodiester glycosidase family protein, partial [Ruminiclostridium sp.]|nr:phosphodiester glycosidase family protein [Ruminiclostridium sp.]